MPKAGWRKLEQHEGEDGTIAVIHMEASSGRFRASAGPEHGATFHYESKDLVDVRTKTKEHLQNCVLTSWEPILFIKRPEKIEPRERYSSWSSPSLGRVELDYERYFRSTRPGGQVIWKEFEIIKPALNRFDEPDEHKNLDKTDGKPGKAINEPREACNGDDYARVPYTPERWLAMRSLSQRLEEINDKIREKLQDKNVESFLASVDIGTNLLPAPKPKGKGKAHVS